MASSSSSAAARSAAVIVKDALHVAVAAELTGSESPRVPDPPTLVDSESEHIAALKDANAALAARLASADSGGMYLGDVDECMQIRNLDTGEVVSLDQASLLHSRLTQLPLSKLSPPPVDVGDGSSASSRNRSDFNRSDFERGETVPMVHFA